MPTNPYAAARREKEQHAERYCPKCLWKIVTRTGPNPCRNHPVKPVFDPCPMHPESSYHDCRKSHAWMPNA